MSHLLIQSAIAMTGLAGLAGVGVWIGCSPIPALVGLVCALFAKRVALIGVGCLGSAFLALTGLATNSITGILCLTLVSSLFPVGVAVLFAVNRHAAVRLAENGIDGVRTLSENEKKYFRERNTPDLEDMLQNSDLLREASEYIESELARRRGES